MTKQPENFAKAIEVILEAVMFENWLRFYFISEKEDQEGKLFLEVPEQGMARITELYPNLLTLAESLNGKELTFESSRTALCTFVVTEIDGKVIPQNMSDIVFDSSTFQIELQLFNTWVQSHEDQLDEGFLEFGAWKNFFSQWRSSDEVKEWRLQLQASVIAPEGKEGTA